MWGGFGVLALAIVLGLVGWWNQLFLQDRLRWFTVIRPYMMAHVRPNVLTAEAEKALRPHDSFKECADCPEMVVLPAGQFVMGSPDSEKGHNVNESRQRVVTIGKALAVSKFETIFAEWDACVAYGDCDHIADDGWGNSIPRGQRPVISVNWYDAKRYVAWLSRMTGKPYRLLSEAEWEYAARAGTQSAYYWGDEVGSGNANCETCGSRWETGTAPVGSFPPNAFGLYDMLGNVWEWVEDCYHDNYIGAPVDGSAWTMGGDCNLRVEKGGSWSYGLEKLRAAVHERDPPGSRYGTSGFRVARTLSMTPKGIAQTRN